MANHGEFVTDKQKELAALMQRLTEECAEIIQATSKCNLFGTESEYEGKTNLQNFQQEVGDVMALVIIISHRHPEVLNDKVLTTAIHKKVARLKKYVASLEDFDLSQTMR